MRIALQTCTDALLPHVRDYPGCPSNVGVELLADERADRLVVVVPVVTVHFLQCQR